jgi:hypothetical protein
MASASKMAKLAPPETMKNPVRARLRARPGFCGVRHGGWPPISKMASLFDARRGIMGSLMRGTSVRAAAIEELREELLIL